MTRSRTPSKVFFMASISICLMTLLIGVPIPSSKSHRSRLHHQRNCRAHRRAQRDRLHEVAFDACWLGMADRIDEGSDIVRQLVFFEAQFTHAGVDVTALVGAIFDL